MLEIKLEQPFIFNMEVVETDDHVPSMRVETKISVVQANHTFDYQGTFWIECAGWSRFANALSRKSVQEAVLTDISGYFVLRIHASDSKGLLTWEFKKKDVGGGLAMASFSSEIDDAMLERIKNEFADFPIWW